MFYFYYGEDTYSIKKKNDFLIKKFSEKYTDLNVLRINGGDLTLDYYFNSILNNSLFAERKFVVINDPFKIEASLREKIIKNLPDLPETTFVIFSQGSAPDKRTIFFKELKKLAGKEEEFVIKDGRGAPLITKAIALIDAKLRAEGMSLDRQARELLLPCDLWLVDNSLEKLILWARSQNKKEITLSDLELLVPLETDNKIYELTDAISGRNKKKALRLWYQLVSSGKNEILLLASIVGNFRTLLSIDDLSRRNLKAQEIADIMKLKPFIITKNMSLLQRLGREKLINSFIYMSEIDQKIKSGSDPALYDQMIISLCS